jgi:RecB family exonuclease
VNASRVTPRDIWLVRAVGLRDYQQAIAGLAACDDPSRLTDALVIVPSVAAADELRETVERLVLLDGWTPSAEEQHALGLESARHGQTRLLPSLVTRSRLYECLYERLDDPRPWLDASSRDVLFRRAADDARAIRPPLPFTVRPGLIAEIRDLYDALGRLGRSVDDFVRLVGGELAPQADHDRGARRLLEQTEFLADTFAAYERHRGASGAVDEHEVRAAVLSRDAKRAWRLIVVTVGDVTSEAGGLWPVDFDVLAQLPGLERIAIVTTDEVLSSGLYERLLRALPDIEERRFPRAEQRTPILVVPPRPPAPAGPEPRFFTSRDREEELIAFARRTKTDGRVAALDRIGLVYWRPLPYLYLARQVLSSAGLPYRAHDALPLASEPYAAALDITSDFVRAASVALLRSPHFVFALDGEPHPSPQDIAWMDRALADARYLGGLDRLRALADRWIDEAARTGATEESRGRARAARALVAAAEGLERLCGDSAAPSTQLGTLATFLDRWERPSSAADTVRHRRARAAVRTSIATLRQAFARFHDEPASFEDIVATLHRAIEAQTFAPRKAGSGVHLVDADAARYGCFDHVHLVGLVEGEWPAPASRSVFYSASLLSQLGWPREPERLAAVRAAFRDLLRLASTEVSASTFLLEHDAIVRRSPFLEELAGMPEVREAIAGHERVLVEEALSIDPVVPDVVNGTAAEWLALRMGRSDPADPRFRGEAGSLDRSSVSVTSIERYLQCPFKYFAADVLRLEEEADDEAGLSPLERGAFVHDALHRFFDRWERAHGPQIALDDLPQARRLFRDVLEECLGDLPEADRAIERQRFVGTAVATGLIEKVLRTEACWSEDVVARLLEHSIDGRYAFDVDGATREVSVRGVADRVDVLAGGGLRVIDYKARRAPRPAVRLQPQLYALCAEQKLEGYRGSSWRVKEAGYLALGESEPFVAVLRDAAQRERALREGARRFLGALDRITAGSFPVDPVEPFRCTFCPYPTVCRKDYVGDE